MADEQSELSIGIRARVLPQLEGAEQLRNQIEQLPSSISGRMQETISSPEFREGLTPQQMKRVEHFTGMSDMMEFEKFQEKQKEIMEELDVDLQAGKLTSAQRKKYLRKFARSKNELGDFQEQLSGELSDPYFDFLGTDKKQLLLGAMNEGTKEAIDNVEKLNKQFENVVNSLGKANVESRTFYDQMKELSVFAIAGLGVREAISYVRTGKEIEAQEKSAFDLSTPMGMYTEKEQYELFKDVRERERSYRLMGGALGIAGGLALSAFTGGAAAPFVLGGAAAGLYGGSELANLENIEESGDVNARLKFMNQTFGQVSGFVNQSQQYDILRARTRARLGREAIGGNLEPGAYAPEQRLQMRSDFADALGIFDSDLYKEQTAFAGATRIDPADIFRLNLSARVTGMDVGIGGLKEAKQTAQELYGSNVSPQRIVEILGDIKTLSEEMLKANMNMDAREALAFSRVPEAIFGVGNPYGRMGDLGMETVRQLEGLMKPQSSAHEAFLYSALEKPDIVEFTEQMKKGIFGDDNFTKVMSAIQRYSGGSKNLSYFMLDEMMPNAPAGMLPKIAELLSDKGTTTTRRVIESIDKETGEIKFAQERDPRTGKMHDKTETVTMTFDELKEEQEKYAKILKDANVEEGERIKKTEEFSNTLMGFSDQAKKNFSASEYFNASMKASANALGDSFRELTNRMSKDWMNEWQKVSENTAARMELIKKYDEALQEVISRFQKQLAKQGVFYNREQIEEVRWEERKEDVRKTAEEENIKMSVFLAAERMGVPEKLTEKVYDLFTGGNFIERLEKKNEETDIKFYERMSNMIDKLDLTLDGFSKNGIKVEVFVNNDGSISANANKNANSLHKPN